MAKKLNVPKLRFPGFQEGWGRKRFGDFAKKSSQQYDPRKRTENYICIELENIVPDCGQISGYFESNAQRSIKNRFCKGDVLFSKLRPYLRKFWIAEFDGICSSEIWVLRPKGLLNEFLYRIVQTDRFNRYCNKSSGTKMPRADWDYVKDAVFFIPSLPEQQKIASFVSLLDQRIEKQQEKISCLEEYKKGLMQKIFSQEIRFKDANGEDYPEWEEKRLQDVCDVFKGSQLSKADLSDNGHPCIMYGELYTRYPEIINYVYSRTQVEIANLVIGQIGDVLFPSSGETSIDISKASCLNVANVAIGGDINICRPKEKADGVYLAYQLNHMLRRDIARIAQGVSIVHIYPYLLKPIKIVLPSYGEQLRIGQFLFKLDELIEGNKELLEQWKLLKKGLLQQMFI